MCQGMAAWRESYELSTIISSSTLEKERQAMAGAHKYTYLPGMREVPVLHREEFEYCN